MNRTALRLSAVASLLGGGAPPFPTMANDLVYDSNSDDIPDLTGDSSFPVALVRTESDSDELIGGGRGATKRELRLIVEFGVTSAVKDKDGSYQVGWPRTDSQLEAFLDLFEWQIKAALLGNTLWAARFRDMWQPGSTDSMPIYYDEGQGAPRVRLAARELTIIVDQAPSDPFPPAMHADDATSYTPVLPDRLLKVFGNIATYGGGNLKITAAKLKTMLEEQSLPKEGRYPPLTIFRAGITLADQPPPPEGQSGFDQMRVELIAPPDEP